MLKTSIWKGVARTGAQWLTAAILIAALSIGSGGSDASAAGIGDDVMLNGGFEQNSQSIPDHWNSVGGWGNPEVSLTTEAARTGTYGMKIETSQNTNPWISQIVPFEEGATYEISAWLKAANVQGQGAGFKLEYYRGQEAISENHILDYDRTFILPSASLTGEWQTFAVDNTAPPEAGLVKVYVRLYGTGKVYFDDASFVVKQHKPMIEMKTDQIFYYSDQDQGQVRAVFDPLDGQLNDKRAYARIVHDATNALLAESAIAMVDVEDPFVFAFDPSGMALTEPYRVEVQLLDSSNAVIDTAEELIYRYDRPTNLTEDGTLLEDGEPFFAVGAYHAGLVDYPYLSAAGINVVQGTGTNNADTLQNELDAAAQNGLRVMVPLYHGMKVQENAAMTTEFVTRFHDHPAVLAWMIMDEPLHNGKTKEELIDAYRLIRSLDDAHPVYMVEAPLEWAYDTTAKLADIFATDMYPLPDKPISLIGKHTTLGKQAAGVGKPVWTVLQAMYNSNHPYLPTIGEVRNMAYQSIINGAQGLAYYSLNETGGFQLRSSALWPGLVGMKNELAVIGRLMTEAERVDDGEIGVDEGRWALWSDEGALYAMAVNTSEETKQVTIPLGVTGYHAELLYGDSRISIDSQSNVLNVQLNPEQALMYRIIPYSSLTSRAMDAADSASLLSADSPWASKLLKLEEALGSIQDELEAAVPDMKAVTKDTLQALRIVRQLADYANHVTNEETQTNMLAALSQIKLIVGPILGSQLGAELELPGGQIAGQQQINTLSIDIQHLANSHISDIRVELTFPESFLLEPMYQTVTKLEENESAELAFPFQVVAPVPEGRYRLAAKIDYEYKGVPVSVEKSVYYKYTDLLHAQAEPGVIRANKPGNYPLEVKLINYVDRPLPISLESDPLPSGIVLQLPESVTLAANQQTTVTGSVYIPHGATEGEYQAGLRILLDGNVVQSLVVPVQLNYNLLHNPGFELPSPDGWLMRQGSWGTGEVHGGQYAVSLIPDGGTNTYNVINSAGFIPVESGKRYVLRGWVKNDSSTGLVQIGLREIRENKVTSVKYTWENVTPDSEWTYYELEVMPEPLSKYLQVYLSSNTHTNGIAWFDDLFVGELLNP